MRKNYILLELSFPGILSTDFITNGFGLKLFINGQHTCENLPIQHADNRVLLKPADFNSEKQDVLLMQTPDPPVAGVHAK